MCWERPLAKAGRKQKVSLCEYLAGPIHSPVPMVRNRPVFTPDARNLPGPWAAQTKQAEMDREGILGRRFGHLTVIEDSGQRQGNSILWRCRCDCGNETLAVRHQLVSGKLQSCGCLPVPRQPKPTDLFGRRFGMLTVVDDSGSRTDSGVIRWRCKCDCGGEMLATRRELVSGNITNCGCVPKQYASKRQAEDLTGRQFGELTALRRVENDKHKRVCWACRCSCGNEIIVQAMQLKSGKTRSCGCKRYATSYNKCDLTGQRFGRLTVLFRSDRNDAPANGYWRCRCDCGKEVDVFSGSLLRGQTQR